MEMEQSLTAPVDGVVELLVAVEKQVKVVQSMARITTVVAEYRNTKQPTIVVRANDAAGSLCIQPQHESHSDVGAFRIRTANCEL